MSRKEYALTLDSEAFNSLKSDFNQLLRQTLSMMLQKEGEKAEMKLTLKITSLSTRLAQLCSTRMRKAALSAAQSMSWFGTKRSVHM
jgi:hypothetical protein